jgi:hypothetical protein
VTEVMDRVVGDGYSIQLSAASSSASSSSISWPFLSTTVRFPSRGSRIPSRHAPKSRT